MVERPLLPTFSEDRPDDEDRLRNTPSWSRPFEAPAFHDPRPHPAARTAARVRCRWRAHGPVIATEGGADRSTPTVGLSSPERAFERLRCAAAGVLEVHVRNDGVCAGCGCGWPCRTVVLAENNLALVNDAVPIPPDAACAARARPS
ncbi:MULTISPECIES: hypothetical protein [unclassified Frankia]|uniref:hypothetical protein n=1 Tax=unclassified Frankia TaxID=2632575 RepID=UPI002AD4E5A6|nr:MULTISPECIES: hypothetical protein [unclassified Frankia]